MNQVNENNIAGRIDRLPVAAAHWKFWFYHEMCWILGSIGLATATFTLASIGTEFDLSATSKGLVASSMFLGMFIGASTSGYLGDKFGRKRMLIMAIVVWSVGAFLIAWSPNLPVFFGARLIIGLGMGAQFPMTQSMLSELFPAKARGRSICLLEGGYPLACIIAGIISWILLMFFDWRVIYFVQGLGGLCAFLVYFKIPESARWLECLHPGSHSLCRCNSSSGVPRSGNQGEDAGRHFTGMMQRERIGRGRMNSAALILHEVIFMLSRTSSRRGDWVTMRKAELI